MATLNQAMRQYGQSQTELNFIFWSNLWIPLKTKKRL